MRRRADSARVFPTRRVGDASGLDWAGNPSVTKHNALVDAFSMPCFPLESCSSAGPRVHVCAAADTKIINKPFQTRAHAAADWHEIYHLWKCRARRDGGRLTPR